MQKFKLVFAVSISALLLGCPVRSLQPLFSEKQLVFNPDLIGKWVDGEDVYAFRKADDNEYEILLTEQKTNDSTRKTEATPDTVTYIGRLGRLGGNWFLDTYPARESGDFHMLPTHVISKMWFDGDALKIASLEGDWLEKAVKAGRVSVQHAFSNGDMILTGSTKELQEVVQKLGNNEDAFPNPAKLMRMK